MKRGFMLAAACAGLLALGACSGRGELRCIDASRYLASASSPPLRIPDDLSVPDESQALRIPPATGALPEQRTRGNCLESPPDYASGAVTPAQPDQ